MREAGSGTTTGSREGILQVWENAGMVLVLAGTREQLERFDGNRHGFPLEEDRGGRRSCFLSPSRRSGCRHRDKRYQQGEKTNCETGPYQRTVAPSTRLK